MANSPTVPANTSFGVSVLYGGRVCLTITGDFDGETLGVAKLHFVPGSNAEIVMNPLMGLLAAKCLAEWERFKEANPGYPAVFVKENAASPEGDDGVI